jgi:hypothetical protein
VHRRTLLLGLAAGLAGRAVARTPGAAHRRGVASILGSTRTSTLAPRQVTAGLDAGANTLKALSSNISLRVGGNCVPSISILENWGLPVTETAHPCRRGRLFTAT